MNYTPKQYARALYLAISETRPDDQDRVIENFVAILKDHGNLSRIDEIEQEFQNYDRETKGIKVANVATAQKLSDTQERQLVRELNEYLGGQVELRTVVDKGWIGGVVIKIGDELIDASVRKNLSELKKALIK